MTRQIVLDTETTGLNYRLGNRVIEIGCVELVNRKLTGNNFHYYLNPERDSEEGALAVHGLTTEFLSDKPKFTEIAKEFISYISGAEIIIHNAPFDVGFLNAEFERLGLGKMENFSTNIVDSLAQAKELHPGKRNSLDALCDRYEISNKHRKLHGALLDAELLADVFLAMSRGQNSLVIEQTEEHVHQDTQYSNETYSDIIIHLADADEVAHHQKALQQIAKEVRGLSIWQAQAE